MPRTESFKKLMKNVRREYIGDKVPMKFRKRYGKVYGEKDVKSVAYAIAKSRGVKIH